MPFSNQNNFIHFAFIQTNIRTLYEGKINQKTSLKIVLQYLVYSSGRPWKGKSYTIFFNEIAYPPGMMMSLQTIMQWSNSMFLTFYLLQSPVCYQSLRDDLYLCYWIQFLFLLENSISLFMLLQVKPCKIR